jgi:hypothetical protein
VGKKKRSREAVFKEKRVKTGREGATGRTVGGYSPAKLEIRAAKRAFTKESNG